MGNLNAIFASLIWGSVGIGFFIYGKKQRSAVPLCGGLVLIGISYFFLDSALYMSLAGAALVVGMVWMIKRG